jgi:hypothetical protein
MNLGARREPANRLPSIKYPLQSEMTNRQICLIHCILVDWVMKYQTMIFEYGRQVLMSMHLGARREPANCLPSIK